MRIILALASALMLAGCSLMGPHDAEALRPGKTVAMGDHEGILIYGVTIEGIRPGDEGIVGKVTWLAERDPTDLDSYAIRHDIPFPDHLQPGQHRFVVWRVPAGLWSLRQFRWIEDKRAGASQPLAGHAWATTVTAGEVTYAGDFVLDARRQPAQVTVTDDAAAARDALAAYPGITGPMRTHLPEDIRKSKRAVGKDAQKEQGPKAQP
ncbi:MAG: hypothetical protein M0006_01355 [Magnetospirillum sp.]|nr:hypothetical protein [Magnetospirillum sp.]